MKYRFINIVIPNTGVTTPEVRWVCEVKKYPWSEWRCIMENGSAKLFTLEETEVVNKILD